MISNSPEISQGARSFGTPAGDEVDIRQLFELLLSGRWLIASITLVALLSGLTYLLIATPIYEADGLVQVETDSKASSDLGQLTSLLFGNPVETEAEIQIIRSRMVLDQAIDKMNLLIESSPKYFPLIGGAVARRNSGARSPVGVPSFLRSYAWGGEVIEVPTFEVPPGFVNQAFTLRVTENGYQLADPDGKPILKGVIGEAATGDSRDGPVSIFVRDLRGRPGTEFSVVRYSRQYVQKRLSGGLTVAEEGRQSGVIRLSFTAPSPMFATSVVNSIENSYLRQNVERRSAQAQQSLEYLKKQLPELKSNADQAQARLNSYQLQKGSVDITRETELVLQQSVELESQRVQLVQQREEALQRFTTKHPVVQTLDQQLAVVTAEQEKIKKATEKLPTTQQEILGLMRDLDVDNQIYTEMLDSIQQLEVAKAGTVGNVRIVDSAVEPVRPTSPKRTLVIALSLLLGVVGGMTFVVVQRAMLKGVDDPAEVEKALNLVTYASIPYSSGQKRLTRSMMRKEGGGFVLALSDNKDLSIEALRSLRSSLHFALVESSNNIVMLTGPAPGLGKSFIATNLGAVLAMSGKRVLVIDADLRRGHMHTYFAADEQPGLSEYIAGVAESGQILQKTKIEGLFVITRGSIPPNPAELLLHERFATLLSALSGDFDYILIDTPPILAVTDASIVGRLAGCSLMILKSGEHPIREIEESHRRLVASGVQVKGVIFNQVGARAGSYGYGGYGYSYYRYES